MVRKSRPNLALLALLPLLLIAFIVPAYLGVFVAPIGQGPDEFDHIDYTFFRFVHPDKVLEPKTGLLAPGYGPTGQGHQAPLSYWIGARLLSVLLDPADVGAFIDYQAGLSFNSANLGSGGAERCFLREGLSGEPSGEVQLMRLAIHGLRVLSAFYLLLSILCGYALGRLIFPDRPSATLCTALLTGMMPTAVWRSTFVNNDNLLALFGSFSVLVAVYFLLKVERRYYGWAMLMGVIGACCFLTKYHGVVALGIFGLAVLLKPHLRLMQRLGMWLLMSLVASALVARDLWTNLRVDGDLLSKEAMIHTVPFLHFPSSFWDLVFTTHFVPTLLRRTWLEYFNLGFYDERFPLLWVDAFWWFMLGVSGLAVLSVALTRFQPLLHTRVLLLVGGALVGTIVVIAYGGTTFPLPSGRYLHVVSAALAVLIVCACTGVVQPFGAKAVAVIDRTLLLVTLAFFLCSQLLTIWYFRSTFLSCKELSNGNIAGGPDLQVGDLDGDGIDELFVFHRYRARTFVAKLKDGRFSIVPVWTRLVGLFGDHALAGDTNNDGAADLVFYRPITGAWTVASGNSILSQNTEVSVYPDLSSKGRLFKDFTVVGDRPLVRDIDRDGRDDIGLVVDGSRRLLVRRSGTPVGVMDFGTIEPTEAIVVVHGEETDLGQPKQPLVLAYNNTSGEARLLSSSRHSASPPPMPLATDLQVIDADLIPGGLRELVAWNQGQHCVSIFELALGESLDQMTSVSNKRCLRVAGRPFALEEYHQVLPIRLRREGQDLIAIDKRTGLLTLFEFSTTQDWGTGDWVEGSEFDLGWYSAATRAISGQYRRP